MSDQTPQGPPPEMPSSGIHGPLQPSVTTPMSSAFDLTRMICFEPFDIGRWFILGFLAWLTDFLRQGANFGSSWRGGPGGGGPGSGSLDDVVSWIDSNLAWILAGTILVLIISYLFMMLVFWLRSRADFAFLANLAHNTAEIRGPWNEFQREGNSLFMLRAVIYTIGFVIGAILLGVGALIGYSDLQADQFTTPTIVTIVVVVLIMIFMGIGMGLLTFFIDNFVVPIMYARRCTATEGLKDAWALMTANLGTFFLYLLMKIVISIAVGLLAGVLTCLTCCIAALPVVRCVVLLPVFVFLRGYSAYFIDQFGPQYRIFPETLYFDTSGYPAQMPPSHQ
ncbi:hypothetical protein KQI84_04210 [bacterium]|nr:hypothetical protein [bacterium]